jgi:hypothetical protein
MIDLSRLAPEELEVWNETFPDGFPEGDGYGFRLWSYGAVCALELGEVPVVVVERMKELGVWNDLPLQYQENMRRRLEARRREQPQ